MYTNIRRLVPLFLVVSSICCMSGCHKRTIRGDQSIYTFAGWIGVAMIAGGIIGPPAGWLLRRVNKKVGFMCMFMSPVLLIMAPDMYTDKVVVDSEHFEARYGFWFAPNIRNVRFKDLREIRHVAKRDYKNRIVYDLQCITKSGDVVVVPCGDLFRNAVPEILERARAQNVSVLVQTS